MVDDLVWSGSLSADIRFGFLDSAVTTGRKLHPEVVINADGVSVLRTLREQIANCRSFVFSVAFVTPRAVALLKQELVDFGGIGTIITSDYLGFNSPRAFRELKNLEVLGVEVRLHQAHAFHPKGYIFQHEDGVTLMVGSSNLTEGAISKNHEWNLKVSASKLSNLSKQVDDLVSRELEESVPITDEWIDSYEESYIPLAPAHSARQSQNSAPVSAFEEVSINEMPILPNRMQEAALKEIEAIRVSGARRAIVVSATGTGKTILSALEVRAANPKRFLFIVHREQIVAKTMSEYQRILGGDPALYGKVSGTSKEFDCKYVFATIQTLSQEGVLKSIGRDAFDYIIVDEAHRVGAASYIRVLNYLQPSFLLGLTATPERGDGFNIFEFFDYNVPYEIRLNHALEEGMLSPFHYYGIADIELEDGRQLSPQGHLRNLVDSKRVEHIIRAIEVYGQAGVDPRGLIFCSRSEEATEISNALNLSQLRGRTLRTVALSAKDSSEARAEAVRQLESGAIDYILTVDIFNEGVDIPSINQVIMLRQTASAIVFVQQLGRGLRKFRDKEYLVVIDFIGNYANNYLIPIALFGEESLNKEYLKEKLIAAEQSGVLPGLSSVRFDRISQERILDSINHTKLDSIRNLKSAVQAMKNRVGSRPKLWDFYRFESVDPVLLATKRNNYAQLLALLKIENNNLSENEDQALAVLSHEVLPAKRLHEFVLATALFRGQSLTPGEIKEVFEEAGLYVAYRTVESVISSFTLDNHAQVDLNRYKTGLAEVVDNRLKLRKGILDAYAHGGRFSEEVDDLLRTGTAIVEGRYLGGSPFVPGVQYSRKEVTRLLGMPRKWTSTLYGYKVDRSLGVCPIFVTLHKSDEVSASIAYQDELVDHGRMRWFTKARRTLQSNEIQPILRNEVTLHVFVKKDDAEGSDFFYLGEAKSSSAQQTQMPDDKGHALDVVVMDLIFSRPVSAALFDYFHPTLAIVD